ncbi:MAG: carbamoyltransferase HypF, partial [Deltaproteobacteria bacterium]|nr:carbamoyltransferase HypF [Deltaproteobacteria bacterium]
SACRRDLFNPTDRRYRYPFINCTGCGPRLTIINDIPYDRRTTSMACFPLCPACQREYDNPADRRFHAEPNACPDCGPSLALYEHDGTHRHTDDPLTDVIKLLKQDRIIAIKGIGGFHLCIDASSTQAVTRLRNKKYREEKPLAVMVRDINNARKIAHISSQEQLLLESPQRPIVLVKKHEEASISPAVAPGMNRLGIMLAYSPMHLLLLENNFTALVMTSANKTDEPICIGNREALNRLSGIADAFLTHNRDILVRCDDSIAFVTGDATRITRRSRGYAPVPHQLDSSYPDILALGPQLKSTVCVLTHNRAYLSPHIGDLETPEARDFFIESIDVTQKIARCNPDIIVTDMHPGYFSTRHAAELKPRKLLQVQHHHAHIVSCMAENDLSGQVIGLAMDGTGYGTDGTIWGGEFLVADPATFSRSGHLQTFSLPGGDKAI